MVDALIWPVHYFRSKFWFESEALTPNVAKVLYSYPIALIINIKIIIIRQRNGSGSSSSETAIMSSDSYSAILNESLSSSAIVNCAIVKCS